MTARRLVAAIMVATCASLAPVTPAAADNYPPGIHVVLGTLSESTIHDGAVVVLSGQGFASQTILRLSIDGVQRGTVTTDLGGVFSTGIRLHGVGTHSVAATGTEPNGQLRVVSDPVMVLAALTRAQSVAQPSAATPQRTLPALLGGLGLVVLLAAAFVLVRARSVRPIVPR